MKGMRNTSYCIAGLDISVSFPEIWRCQDIFPSFEPFRIKDAGSAESVCSIVLSTERSTVNDDAGKLLSDVSAVWGERFRFYEQPDCYVTTIRSDNTDSLWKMVSSKDFSSSVIHMPDREESIATVLCWLTMVAFGQACLRYRTVLIHASVIACHGKGYAFLGKSGTGKSTHSRLWLEHVHGAELLNDDNPAVRLEDDGEVYIYGTPWSGKTDCYKNIRAKMQAFVRLRQAPYNDMSRKANGAALLSILPSCTAIRWNKGLFSEMTDTVAAIIDKVAVTELDCLPNRDAALLCYRGLNRTT